MALTCTAARRWKPFVKKKFFAHGNYRMSAKVHAYNIFGQNYVLKICITIYVHEKNDKISSTYLRYRIVSLCIIHAIWTAMFFGGRCTLDHRVKIDHIPRASEVQATDLDIVLVCSLIISDNSNKYSVQVSLLSVRILWLWFLMCLVESNLCEVGIQIAGKYYTRLDLFEEALETMYNISKYVDRPGPNFFFFFSNALCCSEEIGEIMQKMLMRSLDNGFERTMLANNIPKMLASIHRAMDAKETMLSTF